MQDTRPGAAEYRELLGSDDDPVEFVKNSMSAIRLTGNGLSKI